MQGQGQAEYVLRMPAMQANPSNCGASNHFFELVYTNCIILIFLMLNYVGGKAHDIIFSVCRALMWSQRQELASPKT